MSESNEKLRVLIAITEKSPVDALWRAALRRLGRESGELTAVYLSEDHWQRAASLPFTREISRVSGTTVEFTLQRASQVHEDAVRRAREVVNKLASDARLTPAFEVLTGSDLDRARELFAGAGNLLIAPSLIRRRPIFAEFEKLGCRIELVEEDMEGLGDRPEADDNAVQAES
jgi:hypothetical protein